MNFPWLLSNVLDTEHHKPLGMSESKCIIEFNEIKVVSSFFVESFANFVQHI